MKRNGLQALARKVASEVWDGFSSHMDQREAPARGDVVSVVFDVWSESLRDMNVHDLNPAGVGVAGDFVSRIYRAFTDYIRVQGDDGRTLHCLAIRPQVVGQTYTGMLTLDDETRVL